MGGSGHGAGGSGARTATTLSRKTKGEDKDAVHPLAHRGTWMDVPENLLEHPEPSVDFHNLQGAYPLRGRPFGLAFVWSNVYQDSSNRSALQIAEDSASKFAEVLQCIGYEVRPRKNCSKKYIMDDLSDENISILRDTYDTVLVYIAGFGDGKSFLSQLNEVITIEEIWARFDAVGMVGKPRVLIMDMFHIRSTLMSNFLEDIENVKKTLEEFKIQLEVLTLQGLEHPKSMVQRTADLEAEVASKQEKKKEMRYPPAPGMPARMALMTVPLRSGVARWVIKIRRLSYQITLGVCVADPLQKWYGVGVERYTGLHDFCGSDEYGWAFNQCGKPLHNVHGGLEKPSWGKIAHLRAGDEVLLTLDMNQGVMRMEVPGKFKAARTQLLDQHLLNPEEKGFYLVGAVSLYDLGDEVEVLSFHTAESEAPVTEMAAHHKGAIWDRTRSAGGLAFDGAAARRVDGDGLADLQDTLVFLHRQPVTLAPRSIVRGKPVGECWRGIFNSEPEESEGLSLFSHLLSRRLRASLCDEGESSEADAEYDKWETDEPPTHTHSRLQAGAVIHAASAKVSQASVGCWADASSAKAGATTLTGQLYALQRGHMPGDAAIAARSSVWARKRSCITASVVVKLAEDMRRQTLQAWLRGMCALEGSNLDQVIVALELANVGIDEVKLIVDKSEIEDLGITKRQHIDAVFRGITEARNEATGALQKLHVYTCSTLRKKLIFSGPAMTWSRHHVGDTFAISWEGDVASKNRQCIASNTIMCSLESTLRGIKKYGAVMPGGGKHAWDFTIERMQSAQGEGRENSGCIRLGVVQTEAILYGEYSILTGTCHGGTQTTIVLEHKASEEDGVYEGLHVVLTEGVGAGQCSRIYGYTGCDRTLDVVLALAPDTSTKYSITRLTGFEIGDDPYSWALASSATGRAAAMHGDVTAYTAKCHNFQGRPNEVNRVTSAGYEQAETYPRNLGDALKEGDVVTMWLDLDTGVLAFSVNGSRLGDGIDGVKGPVVPAASCPAATECTLRIGNYRRWAPESGWASAGEELGSGLSDDEILQLKRAFRAYDKGGAGSVKITEMRGLLSDLGVVMLEAEMNDYLDQVDADGSGTLDIMEFYKVISDIKANGQWSLDKMPGAKKEKRPDD